MLKITEHLKIDRISFVVMLIKLRVQLIFKLKKNIILINSFSNFSKLRYWTKFLPNFVYDLWEKAATKYSDTTFLFQVNCVCYFYCPLLETYILFITFPWFRTSGWLFSTDWIMLNTFLVQRLFSLATNSFFLFTETQQFSTTPSVDKFF